MIMPDLRFWWNIEVCVIYSLYVPNAGAGLNLVYGIEARNHAMQDTIALIFVGIHLALGLVKFPCKSLLVGYKFHLP